MARYLAAISGADYDTMADLRRRHNITVQRNSVRRTRAGGTFTVQAIVDEAQMRDLEQAGYQVRTLENLDESGVARQAEVGRGDRYRQQ